MTNVHLLQKEWSDDSSGAHLAEVIGVFSTRKKALKFMALEGLKEAPEDALDGYFIVERTLDAELAKRDLGEKSAAD